MDDLRLFNEERLNEGIETGKIYRPKRFAMMFIQEGSISIKYNLSEFEVGKGDLLFVMPSAAYEFSQWSSDLQLVGVSISREFLHENGVHTSTSRVMETFAAGFQPHYRISETEFSAFLNLIQAIMELVEEDQAWPFIRETRRHGFLTIFYQGASIYRSYNAAYKTKLNRSQELSVDFLRLLSERFRTERKVQFYADQLFVTARHLSQVVKQTTGRTAGEFIDRAVMMEAKILLRDPSKNIGQVAEELSFSDQFAFAKFFKKHTGMTPTQYRSP